MTAQRHLFRVLATLALLASQAVHAHAQRVSTAVVPQTITVGDVFHAAVRVEDQGRNLVAFLPKAADAAVLQDLQSNGQAAISFARPTDDRAVQVKGEFLSVRDAQPDEEKFVLGQWQALLTELDMIGLAALTSTSTWLMWPCVAVTIRVTAVFSQTPGPEAGAVLS